MTSLNTETCRNAVCFGDIDTLKDFVDRHLQGRVQVLATLSPGQTQVRLFFPLSVAGKLEALHQQKIRDMDGGECRLSLVAPDAT